EDEIELGPDEDPAAHEDVDGGRDLEREALRVVLAAVGAHERLAREPRAEAQAEVEAPHGQGGAHHAEHAVLVAATVALVAGHLVAGVEEAEVVGRAREHEAVEAVAELAAQAERGAGAAVDGDAPLAHLVARALGLAGDAGRA